MFAWELRASYVWPLDNVLGMQSIANTVWLSLASVLTRSSFWPGWMKLIKVFFGFRLPASSREGGLSFKTTSAL